jgi:hypothetical protein
MTRVKAGHRRRRAPTTGGIENRRSGQGLYRGYDRQPNKSPQTTTARHSSAIPELLFGPRSESARRDRRTPSPLLSRMDRGSQRVTAALSPGAGADGLRSRAVGRSHLVRSERPRCGGETTASTRERHCLRSARRHRRPDRGSRMNSRWTVRGVVGPCLRAARP